MKQFDAHNTRRNAAVGGLAALADWRGHMMMSPSDRWAFGQKVLLEITFIQDQWGKLSGGMERKLVVSS
jgi:hypothetical protein